MKRKSRKARSDEAVATDLMRAIANLAPKPGSGITSVTISAGDQSVTLTEADGKRIRQQIREATDV